MNLHKLLSGFVLGEKQESGVMSVIPLLSKDDATNNLASFEDLQFKGTIDYGSMKFKNNNSILPFLLPSGYSVITNQQAQDHGTTFSYLIKPMEERVLTDTCCIEQSQGGYIKGDTVKDFNILPMYVRKHHFKSYTSEKNEELKIKDGSFSRLWPIISAFQNKLVEKKEAHIVYFFNKFVDKLNQFNAEFEIVNNQRGAIILLNNRIVGIEIAPTREYWKTVWKKLIRDCYGSEVIRMAMNDLIGEFQQHQELDLNLDSCMTIEDIEAKLEEYKTAYQTNIGNQLEVFLERATVSLSKSHSQVKSNEHNNFNYHLFKVKNEDVYGEAFTENDKVVYASVLF